MFSYKPSGVCAREIQFELNGDTIEKVQFIGGCPGNTLGLSLLRSESDRSLKRCKMRKQRYFLSGTVSARAETGNFKIKKKRMTGKTDFILFPVILFFYTNFFILIFLNADFFIFIVFSHMLHPYTGLPHPSETVRIPALHCHNTA